MNEEEHKHRWTTGQKVALGATLLAGGIIAAPYIIPAANPGTNVGSIMAVLHGNGLGTGLAGAINGVINHIPVIGHTLAMGGYASMFATAGIGIGGLLLARYLEKKENNHPTSGIRWSKVVRYASLATSILIALPSIITGLSVGICFLATVLGGVAFGNTVLDVIAGTMGSAGAKAGVNLVAATFPHLLTCGAALVPLGLRQWLDSRKEKPNGPLSLHLASSSPIQKGVPATLAFELRDSATGKKLGPEALARVHTEKLHTMIVDASLTDYHHLHPHYDAASGLFTCQFTPSQSQPYRAWHDITRADTGEQCYLHNDLPSTAQCSLTPTIRQTSQLTTEELRVEMTSKTPLRAGENGTFTIDIRGKMGEPLTDLEPLMGAYAHLVGFHQDGKHILHCHPMGPEPTSEQQRGAGRLTFHITPEQPGPIKFFLQIKRHGVETTIPFGQIIAQNHQFTHRKAVAAPHEHHAMAMG